MWWPLRRHHGSSTTGLGWRGGVDHGKGGDVITLLLRPLVITHRGFRLAPKTNTSLTEYFGLTRTHLKNFPEGRPF